MQEPQGQEKQFIEAFEAHSDELLRHALLRLSDRERALELVQETYLRTWEYLRRGGEIREMRPFLYRTLRNLIVDEYRRHKSLSLENMLREEDESIESLMPPDEGNTLEAAMARFDAAQTLALVAALPDLYREVVLLRYVDGFTPKEIAGQLDASENVVSVRLHRALKRLRALLENTHEA